MPAYRRMKRVWRRTAVEHSARFVIAILANVTLILSGCGHAPPLPIDEAWVMQQVSSRYQEFFFAGPGALSPGRGAGPRAQPTSVLDDDELVQGLLRPRLGLPAIVRAGTEFSIEMLERRVASPADSASPSPAAPRVALLRPEVTTEAAVACLGGTTVPGCHLLRVEALSATAASGGAGLFHTRYTAHLDSPLLPPPGGYDLYVSSGDGDNSPQPTRAPRAVWLRAEDPTTLDKVRVAHLSDLHVGKGRNGFPAQILTRLHQVIAEVNRLSPDLVIVTGDIIHSGQQPQLWPIAQQLLSDVAAPVLVVLGNHDIEFRQRGIRSVRRYGEGWANFARTFHPFLHFSLSLGGYDFVGFDSGPAERTARILTRGLHPSSVALLRDDMARAQEHGRRGIVLFSHAPSRASTFNRVLPRSIGFFGRMRYGNAAFEDALVEAAERGQRVLHLSGHTHWSDVFELDEPSHQFRRWPLEALSRCPKALHNQVALITTQSASHAGLFSKSNARGYGFSMLTLGEQSPELEFFRYGAKEPGKQPKSLLKNGSKAGLRLNSDREKVDSTEPCPHNLATRLADTERGGKLL